MLSRPPGGATIAWRNLLAGAGRRPSACEPAHASGNQAAALRRRSIRPVKARWQVSSGRRRPEPRIEPSRQTRGSCPESMEVVMAPARGLQARQALIWGERDERPRRMAARRHIGDCGRGLRLSTDLLEQFSRRHPNPSVSRSRSRAGSTKPFHLRHRLGQVDGQHVRQQAGECVG